MLLRWGHFEGEKPLLKFCQSYEMDLIVLDNDAKFNYVVKQVKLDHSTTDYWFKTARLWYGAVRDPAARSQYEFRWVNGVKTNLKRNSWQITEDSTWREK